MSGEKSLEVSIEIAKMYAAINHSMDAENLIGEIKSAQNKNTKSLFGDLANVITVGGAILTVVKYVHDCYTTGRETLKPEEIDAGIEQKLGQQDIISDEEMSEIKKMALKKFKYMV